MNFKQNGGWLAAGGMAIVVAILVGWIYGHGNKARLQNSLLKMMAQPVDMVESAAQQSRREAAELAELREWSPYKPMTGWKFQPITGPALP